MATVLGEGRSYGLVSNCGLKSSGISEDKTVVHVKLTDTAIKAIEEFRALKSKFGKMTIQCSDNFGQIIIPMGNSNQYEFQFSLTDSVSSFECIKDSRTGKTEILSRIGEASTKLSVMATDDVYQMTKERMLQAEEDSQRFCAKEIALDDPDKGKKVKKVIPPSSLQLVAQKLTSGGRQPLLTPGSQRTMTSPVEFGAKPLLAPSRTGSRPVTPSPVEGRVPRLSGIVAPKASKKPMPQNALKPTSNSSVSNFPYRDRIIHLLALRPMKKIEIINRLQKEGGIAEKERNQLTQVLQQVAQFRNNSYYLQPNIYSEIRLDWPLYTEENRQQLSKELERLEMGSSNGDGSAYSSPALSPCLSNASSHGSPQSSQSSQSQGVKRGAVLDTDIKYHEPPKKQRIAHTQKTMPPSASCEAPQSTVSVTVPVISKASVNNTVRPFDKKAVISPAAVSPPVDCQENISNKPTAFQDSSADYHKLHVQIVTPEQRRRYKQKFDAEFAEYNQLYEALALRTKRLKELNEELCAAANTSHESYQVVKEQVCHELNGLRCDQRYKQQRERCDYLHGKLGHIKSLITEYDHRPRSALPASS